MRQAKPPTRLMLLALLAAIGVALVSSGVGNSVATLGSPDPSTGEMLMLCAAMLLVAAASALLALRLRRLASAGGFSVDRLLPGTARQLPARVGTGPPHVWEFSVVKC